MNAFEYAAKEEGLFEPTGYKRLTTFYSDLSIAEWFGRNSIMDTYNTVCEEWIDDYRYFTEFVMCLNLKSWEHSAREGNELSEFYADLYYKARDLFYEHYKDDDDNSREAREYFFETTD